jgi:hypothetical protein
LTCGDEIRFSRRCRSKRRRGFELRVGSRRCNEFVRIVDLALLVGVEVALGAEHTRAAVLHVMAEKLAGLGRPAPFLALRDSAVVIARVLRIKAGAVVAAAVFTFANEMETVTVGFDLEGGEGRGTSAGGGGHNCCDEEDLEHSSELQIAKCWEEVSPCSKRGRNLEQF